MLLSFTAATSFAQMNSGVKGGQQQHSGNVMTAQQSQTIKSGQMTNQEMMRDMAGMMKQMNETMQKMTHTIENKTVMEPRKLLAMGKMTREMAAQMNEMADHMEPGFIDKQMINKMQERMKSMHQKIDAMQNEGK
jgi:hypothetical protein